MKVCLLCLLTVLLQQGSPSRVHKSQAHHGHSHGTHIHDSLRMSQTGTASGHPHQGLGPSEAVNEQNFYIQQLFIRYGNQDRLDFNGFQSLLLSLGLGQVRLLGLEHENLGHDHVAHLDMLDVQEGLHTHSPQNHVHSLPRSEPEHNRTTTQPPPCRPGEARATESPGASSGEHHGTHVNDGDQRSDERKEPERHPHHHRHLGEQQELEGAGLQPSAVPPGTQSGKPKKPNKNKEPRSKAGGHGNREHDHKQRRQHDPKHNPDQAHDHEHKHDHEPSHEPSQDRDHIQDHDHDSDPSQDQGQDSRRDADLVNNNNGQNKRHLSKRSAPVRSTEAIHNEDVTHQHEECLNLTQLLHYYGLSPDALISPTQFSYLCPALLYQIDSRVCIRHYHQVELQPSDLQPAFSVWTWLWGFVSITIISLLSLLGVLLVPIIKQSCFKFLLTFLVALAVGTLSGDALLHLLPHSQGEHDHSSSEEGEEEADLATTFDGVWKGLTALAGIYLLFIIEHCIGMFKHYRDQQESWCSSSRKQEEAKIGRKLSDHQMNRRSDVELMHLKPLPAAGADSSASSLVDSQSNPKSSSPQEESSSVRESTQKAKAKMHGHAHSHSHGHGHAHHSHCHSDQEMKDAGIASIAWMVIMGDGMHNFSDGLAIGAAFSANVTGGISTSVAVFCHELPHELGDFAVLLKAGMSVKQAIVYNLLSALMAYVGMLIGTAVGQYTHNVTSWIFAITAGMFLYVALVDMLPEMLHGDSEDHKRCQMGHFLLQNLGMLSGFAIMLLIAIFEERIVLDFGL
ncbi:zinc transporter ZIP10 [Brienomyrus brachyistius]|uniref:zinc transporter ZIP10 n=1 Tax=Brienomyrus brachyistius TaxID=42636 RepID=UPI0020B38383|nr:zinc transporter ZIP10 [Brienomyrus brachyistius]XP_048834160.1 zinc transporter ZIP10 [Brienomyrus brachyistius]XP_048834161.1 zinc transporter ZIP10 [Brienomyrus brachyistius]XP_048834163.1 zinc transporter ZIP10 [Brienomyrus brachyistius]XP_048834164.1 zinc transporter ZIP10 [Brienomyrus brachyistius]XP_048834165.1 zinc transporter ZIP10 [Brienomyrus brachyistius]